MALEGHEKGLNLPNRSLPIVELPFESSYWSICLKAPLCQKWIEKHGLYVSEMKAMKVVMAFEDLISVWNQAVANEIECRNLCLV